MKPTDFYLLPVLLVVLMATLMATPSDGQITALYNQQAQVLQSNRTNPIIAYSSVSELVRQMKPVTMATRTTKTPETTEVGPTVEPAKLDTSTVSGERGTTVGQGIAKESATVQAEDGVTEEDLSEEEEVVDENSATEEVDETKKE